MKGCRGKEAFSRPVNMMRDDFCLNSFKDRPKPLDLWQVFRKAAKAWTSRKISQQCNSENQDVKVNYILSAILAIFVNLSDSDL